MFLIDATKKLTGSAAKFYSRLPQGVEIPAPVRLLAASPDLLEAKIAQMAYFSANEDLSAPLLASIRLAVSAKTNLEHCVRFNAQLLKAMGMSEEEVEQVAAVAPDAPFDPNELALLEVVVKGAVTPDAVSAEDITFLKSEGWSEKTILDAMDHACSMKAIGALTAALSN